MGEVPRSDSRTVEHLLAIKVMRLSRPTYAQKVITSDDTPGFFQGVLNGERMKDPASCEELPLSSMSQLLVLPQSFGTIYLGETFLSYISLHNDSTEACSSISMKCTLQTSTQRIPLYPPSTEETPAQQQLLHPGGSIDRVLSHEVKELGPHILLCDVFYTGPKAGHGITTLEKYYFRKFFKFEVKKPLDVKTKFYNTDNDEIFLEARIQNVTNGSLCLEKVALEPSNLFSVSSLNSIVGLDEENSVFGPVNCLQPNDSRQYLFCLTPKDSIKSDYKLLKAFTSIGKLDIVWRSNMGDKGRLQTSQLQRMTPNMGDIRLTIDKIPSVVMLHQAFSISVKLINNSERTLDLEMTCIDKYQSRLTWSGTVSQKLGLLEPTRSVEIPLSIVPLDTGFHVITGIRIIDSLLKRTYEFDDQCLVFVTAEESIFQAISSA